MSKAYPESASFNHQNNTAPPHTRSEHTAPSPPLKSSHYSFPIDIKYPESSLRTPVYALPFPHPNWSVDPQTGGIYEDTSLMVEALRGELEDVRESVEDVKEEVVMSREKRKKAYEEDGGRGGNMKKIRSETKREK